jgi:hypothetical protein
MKKTSCQLSIKLGWVRDSSAINIGLGLLNVYNTVTLNLRDIYISVN